MKERQEQNQRRLRLGVSYLITSLILMWLFQLFVWTPQARHAEIPYSEFKQKLADAQIVKVTIGDRGVVGEMKSANRTDLLRSSHSIPSLLPPATPG